METINLEKSNYYQETFINGELSETERGLKDDRFKDNVLDKQSIDFFKRLGGKETIKQGSKFGYGCTIHTSISPDKSTKIIRYFFY